MLRFFASQGSSVLAWMLAWQADGEMFPYAWQNEEHRTHTPSEAMVKFCRKAPRAPRWLSSLYTLPAQTEHE